MKNPKDVIDRIKKLELTKNSFLVISGPNPRLTEEESLRLRRIVWNHVGSRIPILLFDEGVEVNDLRTEELMNLRNQINTALEARGVPA